MSKNIISDGAYVDAKFIVQVTEGMDVAVQGIRDWDKNIGRKFLTHWRKTTVQIHTPIRAQQ